MSLAYYIVLEKDDPGFNPFVNGNFLAAEAHRVNDVAAELGLKSLDDLTSYDELEFEGLDLPEDPEGGWFEPDEGIAWLEALLRRFNDDPNPLEYPKGVIADLEECIDVLRKARAAGVRWHFTMDF